MREVLESGPAVQLLQDTKNETTPRRYFPPIAHTKTQSDYRNVQDVEGKKRKKSQRGQEGSRGSKVKQKRGIGRLTSGDWGGLQNYLGEYPW